MLSTSYGMPTSVSGIDYRRLRGELAERMISKGDLAKAAGLHRNTIGLALAGKQAGELAEIKIARGLERLGIDPATVSGPSEQKSRSADSE